MADHERVEVTSREDLRRWLEENHGRPDSIWLVTFRKSAGPVLPYDAIVEEALCFGWVDSLPRALDDTRTMLRLSPRRPKSAWSAINKARVADLTARGLMAPAGIVAVERAKVDGSWAALDAVETLEIPADLAAELERLPPAATHFAAFSRSSRRGILEWIAAAKTEETRRRRIADTARLAADNLKANHPEGRNRGVDPARRGPKT
jgi:uncharacterized protein YdeI (YjbR/CyaY-like superfamily)